MSEDRPRVRRFAFIVIPEMRELGYIGILAQQTFKLFEMRKGANGMILQ